MGRLTSYARAHGLSLRQAVRVLVGQALDRLEVASRGGVTRAQRLTPDQRRAMASKAARARWGKTS